MKKSPNQKGSQLAGKVWMSIMGLFLIAVGSLFMWYLWAFFKKSSQMDDWVKTACVIEKSEIDDSGMNQHYGTMYSLLTEYSYSFEGKTYRSDRYKRIQPAYSDRKKILEKQESFPEGSETFCYVNPSAPNLAVLKKDTKAAIYSIWFPALFVLGGCGIIVSAIRK